jgi:rubredoxin
MNMTTIERKIAMDPVHVCIVCGLVYDPAQGLPEHGVAPGTPWDELPPD